MTSGIKHTQLTRTGYEYQDLVCIGFVVDWYNDPKKYEWIRIEGDIEHGKLKGLDDIICKRPDGSFELVQVKFTIDPSRDDLSLNFDWMLAKKKRGTSMLQKWAKDVLRLSASNLLSKASLKTNRTPDQAFMSSLVGKRIDYKKLSDTVKTQLDIQLGSSQNAQTFCSIFDFEHSEKHIDDYETKLHDRLVPDHTSEAGFHRLRSAIRQSATRRNFPSPKGTWRLSDVEELLRAGLVQKLSQDFSIPPNYLPPSHSFHADLLLRSSNPGCHVVSGQPGMGKSTYLSYLSEDLVRGGAIVIRHHYWLGSSSIVDRISSEHAIKSMMFQLQEIFPEFVQKTQIEEMKFHDCVLAITTLLRAEGKTLVVIVDGLDHVHRDRPDISQLNHLVNRLMPLKEEVCLFFGTQPIDEKLLPTSLTDVAPKKTWIDLPPMDLASIRAWLDGLHESSEFVLNGGEDRIDREMNEISSALASKTMGYPLHLIYSVRELLSIERRLSAYRIEEILPCPNGDIREYYQSLWNRLSAGSKDILLLVACVQFPWPDKGNLSKCYTDAIGFQDAFSALHHLIEQRQSGIHPFHGSLTIFLRATDEFESMSDALMGRVKNWLDDGAPEYWQWGWKWLVEARLGNPKPLLEGTSKDWAVSSFSKGYSIDHIDYIISQSEDYALKNGFYSELVRLRGIRIRVLNGPEYQIQDYPLFLRCALSLQQDDYPYFLKLDNLRFLPDEEIRVVSSLSKVSDDEISKLCFFEVLRRIKLAVKLKDDHQLDRTEELIYIAVDTLSNTISPDVDLLSDFFSRLRKPEKFVIHYLKKLLENGHAETVIEVASYDCLNAFSVDISEFVAWACLNAGVSLKDRSDLAQVQSSQVAQVYSALAEPKILPPKSALSESEISELSYREYFFFEFYQELSDEAEIVDLVDIPRSGEKEFKNAARTALKFLAQTVVQQLKAKGDFSTVPLFQTWDSIDIPTWHESDHSISTHLTSLLHAINEISVELCILSHRAQAAEKITDNSIDRLLEVPCFSSQLWLRHLASKSCQELLSESVAKYFFKRLRSELGEKSENIGILANDALDLCDLACRFHRNSEAIELLELTCLHTLGHGYRKDISFHNLYQAIEHCAEAKIGSVPDWLRRLSAPTNGVFDFTEREIRHLPGWYFILTGQCSFDRLSAEIDYHLERQNWRNVDHILTSFVRFTDASSDTDKALLRCLVSRKPLLELEKRALDCVELKHIYEEQIEFLGGLYLDNEPSYSDTSLSPQQTSLSFSDFPPDKAKDFERSLKDENNISYDEILSGWITYWSDAGEGLNVIAAMEQISEEFKDRGWGFERNIDEIFDLSQKLQGKNAAYKWAVRDVKINQLWSAYGGRDATKRLKKYARTYKKKWQDFLQTTLVQEGKSTRMSLWNLAPTDDLVAFMIEAEEFGEAVAVTEAMLVGFEAGVQHLNLPSEYLPLKPDESTNVSGRMLLSYFFMPDKVVRLKAAKEISSLLIIDANFRNLYLKKLESLVYEADICDFLSILSLGSSSPFSESELRSNIQYPSVLSEYIFLTLGFNHQFANVTYSEFPKEDLKRSERMERSKNGIPAIWDMRLNRLSQDCGRRLDLHMAAEWEMLAKRKQFLFFNHSEFISEKYHSLDGVSCSLSWNCEAAIISAYLRTIRYCLAVGVLDSTSLIEYIIPALPFGKPLSGINPNKRPDFWPNFKDIHSSETTLSGTSLKGFVDEWCLSCEVPLFASGPIPTGENGLDVDLDCIVIAREEDLDQMELESLFGDEDRSLVGRVFHKGIGRWQAELYMRGFAEPKFEIGGRAHTLKAFENQVAFVFDRDPVACWKFWYEEWFPARLRGCGSNIAVSTSCLADDLAKISDAVGSDLVLAVRVKVSSAKFTNSKEQTGEYFASKKIYERKV